MEPTATSTDCESPSIEAPGCAETPLPLPIHCGVLPIRPMPAGASLLLSLLQLHLLPLPAPDGQLGSPGQKVQETLLPGGFRSEVPGRDRGGSSWQASWGACSVVGRRQAPPASPCICGISAMGDASGNTTDFHGICPIRHDCNPRNLRICKA